MTYVKLVHRDPKLNDKKMWYRCVDQTNPDWYFATIWGPNGMISSVIHAVPRSDYTCLEIKETTKKKEGDDVESFF